MTLRSIVKCCLIASTLTYSLSALAITKQPDTSKLKEVPMRTLQAKHAVEAWEVAPPSNGYGFGVYPDDNRVQKIIVHVNEKLNNSDDYSGTIRLTCNNSIITLEAGDTVICERTMNNWAGFFIVLDKHHKMARSEGTMKFITEDITTD